MGEFRDNINSKLSKCEEIYESIDNLLEGLNALESVAELQSLFYIRRMGICAKALLQRKRQRNSLKSLKQNIMID